MPENESSALADATHDLNSATQSDDNSSSPDNIEKKCEKRKAMIVVGLENINSNPANRGMFIAQALRYAKQFKSYDYISVMYHSDHSDEIKSRFKSDISKILKNKEHEIIEYSSSSEIFTEINTIDITESGCEAKIAKLVFVAHGGPSEIYTSPPIDLENYKEMNKEAFSTDIQPQIISDACQTANAPYEKKRAMHDEENKVLEDLRAEGGAALLEGTVKFVTGEEEPFKRLTEFSSQLQNTEIPDGTVTVDENMNESLAQGMANHTGANVKASITQTNYGQSFSTKGLKNILGLGRDKIEDSDGTYMLYQQRGADEPVVSGTGVESIYSDHNDVESGWKYFSPQGEK